MTAAVTSNTKAPVVEINLDLKAQSLDPVLTSDGGCFVKTMTWIRTAPDRGVICHVLTYALSFFVSIVLFLSIVGIPLVLRAVTEITKQNVEAKYTEVMKKRDAEYLQKTQAVIDEAQLQVTSQLKPQNQIIVTSYDSWQKAAAKLPETVSSGQEKALQDTNAALTTELNSLKQTLADKETALNTLTTDAGKAKTDLESQLAAATKAKEDQDAVVAKLTAERDALETNLKTLSQQNGADALLAEKQKELVDAQTRGTTLQTDLDKLTETLAQKQKELDQAQAINTTLQADLDKHKADFKQATETAAKEIETLTETVKTLKDEVLKKDGELTEAERQRTELENKIVKKEQEIVDLKVDLEVALEVLNPPEKTPAAAPVVANAAQSVVEQADPNAKTADKTPANIVNANATVAATAQPIVEQADPNAKTADKTPANIVNANATVAATAQPIVEQPDPNAKVADKAPANTVNADATAAPKGDDVKTAEESTAAAANNNAGVASTQALGTPASPVVATNARPGNPNQQDGKGDKRGSGTSWWKPKANNS